MNRAVFVGFPHGFSPVEILIPLDPWALQAVEPAHERHGAPEFRGPVGVKEAGKMSINEPPLPHRR
ncbi:MAG: hypothetical protein ACRERD_19320 [Candidatus Binatia bacterium]